MRSSAWLDVPLCRSIATFFCLVMPWGCRTDVPTDDGTTMIVDGGAEAPGPGDREAPPTDDGTTMIVDGRAEALGPGDREAPPTDAGAHETTAFNDASDGGCACVPDSVTSVSTSLGCFCQPGFPPCPATYDIFVGDPCAYVGTAIPGGPHLGRNTVLRFSDCSIIQVQNENVDSPTYHYDFDANTHQLIGAERVASRGTDPLACPNHLLSALTIQAGTQPTCAASETQVICAPQAGPLAGRGPSD